MRERIWYDLIDAIYRLQYLCLHIDKIEKRTRMTDNILLLTTFGGIFGWYKFSEHSVFWASLLGLLTGFRIMKNKFLMTDQEINTLKAIYEFHVDHVRKLETLWIKYHNNRISEEDAEVDFEKLRDEERLTTKINKHSRINEVEPLKSVARKQADAHISKILTL